MNIMIKRVKEDGLKLYLQSMKEEFADFHPLQVLNQDIYLEDVIKCSAMSPDLNPIMNLLGDLAGRVDLTLSLFYSF